MEEQNQPEDNYLRDSEGNIVLKKDGTPRKKAGRPKGSKSKSYSYHSETKVKHNVRRDITKRKKEIQRVEKNLEQKRRKLKEKKQLIDKLDAAQGKVNKPAIMDTDELAKLPPQVEEFVEQNSEVVFQPNPGPQFDFLAAPEFDVLYGGAAGGGKSYAMLVDPLRNVVFKEHRALILRKTLKELRELIDTSRELYPQAYPGAKYSQQDKVWKFPNGAKIEFGYLENEGDVYQYQGQQFTWIGFDEITHLQTEFPWNYLQSRIRTTNPQLNVYMRCVDEGEVLTIDGWKDIKDIQPGESIYSLDNSGQMVPSRVSQRLEFDAEEDLVRVKKKNLYMSFTQDHQITYRKFGSDQTHISRWSEHRGKSVDILRSASEYRTDTQYIPEFDVDPIVWARFLGIYIAEGSTPTPRKGNYKVLVTQTQRHKAEEIKKNIFDLMPYNFCYSSNGDFQITNKALHTYLVALGKADKKYIPQDFLKEASKEQLEEFLKWYSYGDGHWQTETSGEMFTTSERLKDNLQEIAVKLGYKTQFRKKSYNNPKWSDKFTVAFTKGLVTKVDKNPCGRDDTQLIPYKGKVYCLEVPEYNNFIIRQKGYVWVSGNCTANPGGVGHSWVKARYIDPTPPNTPFSFTAPNGVVLTRRFIPARLQDNPHLYADGRYEAQLQLMPEIERRRLLDGDWDIVDGMAFPEFRTSIHVIPRMQIPPHWERIKAVDYGYTAPACCLWAAVDPLDGTVIVYKELYQTGLEPSELAKEMTKKELEELEMWGGDPMRVFSRDIRGVIDGQCFARTGHTGPTQAEVLIKAGHKLRPADKNRKGGKIQIHEFLRLGPTGRPRLQIFDTCPNLIRELQTLPLAKNDPEDVDTHASDHAYDALRYLIMSRPRQETYRDRMAKYKSEVYMPADSKVGY